jgi:predicted nucleic acid-binding protein
LKTSKRSSALSIDEYKRVLEDVKREESFATDLSPWLEALKVAAVWVARVPLGRAVCRDPKDDKFIEAALAAGERFEVFPILRETLMEISEFIKTL